MAVTRLAIGIVSAAVLVAAGPAPVLGQGVQWSVGKGAEGQTVLSSGGVSVSFKGSVDSVGVKDGVCSAAVTVADGPTTVAIDKLLTTAVAEKIKDVEIRGNGVVVTTVSGSRVPIGMAPTTAPQTSRPTLPEAIPAVPRLTPEQAADIREELSRKKADSGDVSADLLRPGLMETAERLAANYLKVEPHDLDASVRRQLRAMVDPLVGTRPPRIPTAPRSPAPVRTEGATGWDTDSGEGRSRCECAYCQPAYAHGTCPVPWSLPAMSAGAPYYYAPYYAPAVAYAVPYRTHRHWLHHILCPCSWCRGYP